MDGRSDVGNFSPFYKTSSPTGAAAQKRGKTYKIEKSCLKASNGHRFPCTALLLFSNKIFLVLLRGNRAAAPIGDKVLHNVFIV